MSDQTPSKQARFMCRLFGHKWRVIWNGGPRAHGWPSVACVRCHEAGWVAPHD